MTDTERALAVTIIRELLRTEGWRNCGFGTDNRLRYNEARRCAAEFMNGAALQGEVANPPTVSEAIISGDLDGIAKKIDWTA